MIFTTKTAFKERNDVPYMEAGIIDNVYFMSARKGETKSGAPLIELKFQKDGAVLVHTEFEPVKFPGMTDQDLERKAESQMDRIVQILSVYYSENELNFTTDSFDKLADWVVALMTNAPKVPVRIKATYSNGGFVELPKNSRYTFIERMDAPVSKIRKLSSDRFERPEVDKESKVKSSEEIFKNEFEVEERPF